jgi:hypothetical protein
MQSIVDCNAADGEHWSSLRVARFNICQKTLTMMKSALNLENGSDGVHLAKEESMGRLATAPTLSPDSYVDGGAGI